MALKCMVALPDNAVFSILATPLDQHSSIKLHFDTSRQYLEIEQLAMVFLLDIGSLISLIWPLTKFVLM